jgi:hypothetical protein
MLNKTGWLKLENELNLVLEKINLKMINAFTNEHGLVIFEFEKTEDIALQKLGEILAWYYQRIAAKTCQSCGKWGSRRKDLPLYPTLCHLCYVLAYNEFHESQGENNVLSS